MHIVYVSVVYPPETGWGGIGTYVYHMARAMVARGHRVTVVCGFRELPSVTEEEPNLKVIRGIAAKETNPTQRSIQISEMLAKLLKDEQLDVVEFGEYGGDGLAFQEKHPRFPTVVKLHCPTRLCVVGESPRWQQPLRWHYLSPKARQIEKCEQESVRQAHVVVSPSQWMLSTLGRLSWKFPVQQLVIANPFGGWPIEMENLPQKNYSLPEVVFLGRLARLKGADMMPAIFQEVWRQAPEAYFELVGQDTPHSRHESWGQYIQRKVPRQFRQQIGLRGGVPYLEMQNALQKHSIGVFASALENLPYATLECMWSGLACVVASPGGAQEIGEDGVSVFKTARRPDAIAARIIELIRNSERRCQMAQAARQQVKNSYSCAVIGAQMEGAYQLAIEGAKRV